MNEVLNNILTRRSIRDFSDKLISKENLETIIQAGIYAPSGQGRQTFKFIGVLNQEMIKRLASVIETVLGRDGYNFYNAKALVLISNEKGGKWSRDDNACALQNILLASHSLDIGSVWINQLLDICDNDLVRPILDELEIPTNHEIYGLAALGYSLSEPKGIVPKKAEFKIFE